MRILKIMLLLLLLVGCKESIYDEKQVEVLKENDVLDYAENECNYTESVKLMINSNDFEKKHLKDYCRLDLKTNKNVNFLLDQNASDEDIIGFSQIPYFREENYERYLRYSGSYEKRVVGVNMNMDLEDFETTIYVNDFDDMTLLVNKFSALPEGYVPDDLVNVKYACTIGKEYSCLASNYVVLRKEAEEAFEKFVEAASTEKGITIVSIAPYRSYEYQRGLYNYSLSANGKEYTDKYYARPGQSEHNSGLAVDITIDNMKYTEIENHESYDWILDNLHKYGFILRYPEDKTDITRYGHESWHLRYVGVEPATVMYEKDWCLEEYLARQ